MYLHNRQNRQNKQNKPKSQKPLLQEIQQLHQLQQLQQLQQTQQRPQTQQTQQLQQRPQTEHTHESNQYSQRNTNNNIGQLDVEFERTRAITKHVLIVDSQDRDITKYPSTTSYRIELPNVYKQVKRVRLLSTEVTSSYYIFTNALGNTTLHIGIYDSSGINKLAIQEIVISDGNYDTTTIGPILTDLLNNNDLFQSQEVVFNVYVDPSTFLLNITNSSSRIMYIDTRYVSSLYSTPKVRNWGLEYNLGFAYNTLISGLTLVASQLIKLNPYNYLIMDIRELNRMDDCNRGQNTAFAKVPIGVNSFELITLYENCCTYNQAKLNPYISKLSALTINWWFHDGTPVIFNNVDHSFTLELECLE